MLCIDKIFTDITRQRHNFTGFTVNSRSYGKRHPEYEQIFAHVSRVVTKLGTVTSINDRMKISKLRIAYSRTIPQVLSTRKCLPIVLVASDNRKSNLFLPIDVLINFEEIEKAMDSKDTINWIGSHVLMAWLLCHCTLQLFILLFEVHCNRYSITLLPWF